VPLEMLAACHSRVEHQCSTLGRLVEHLVRNGADADARMAAVNVMRYFDTSAKDHHADEEQDLFPALLASAVGLEVMTLSDLTRALAAEHRELEPRRQQLRASLEPIAAGASSSLDALSVEAFIQLYERHIASEESELLPVAKRN